MCYFGSKARHCTVSGTPSVLQTCIALSFSSSSSSSSNPTWLHRLCKDGMPQRSCPDCLLLFNNTAQSKAPKLSVPPTLFMQSLLLVHEYYTNIYIHTFFHLCLSPLTHVSTYMTELGAYKLLALLTLVVVDGLTIKLSEPRDVPGYLNSIVVTKQRRDTRLES